MTVVCFRDGILCADRLVTASYGGRVGHRSKIFRTSTEGNHYGFSGPIGAAAIFTRWLAEGGALKDAPDLDEHQAIEIRSGNRVALSSGKKPVFIEVEAPFYAIGSGWQLALGAMEMGATAEQAVEVAIRHDEGCGGQIDVIRCYEQAMQFAPQTAAVTFPNRIDPIHLGGPR